MNRYSVKVMLRRQFALELSAGERPVSDFVSAAQIKFGDSLRVVSLSLCDCTVEICAEIDETELCKWVSDNIDSEKSVFEISDIGESRTNCAMQKVSAIDRIDSLVGCGEFKGLMHELQSVAPLMKKHKTFDLFSYRCYLFSISAGSGLTTALELFAELLGEEEIFNLRSDRPVREVELPPADDYKDDLAALVPSLGRGHVICIDISEWLEHLNEKRFRRFLSVIEDYSTDNIVVFRVPFIEDEALEVIRRALSEILTVRSVTFEPFTGDEFRACASRALKRVGYEMDDDAWEVFDWLIQREKSDGAFFGINTVHKVVREMIYAKQVSDAGDGTDDCRIKRDELSGLYASAGYDGRSGEEMLDGMIGMKDIKNRVMEMVSQIELAKASGLDMPCIHMRFVGNPGTGKTTVARAVGKLLKERGILRNGCFLEHSGRDFCGKYVGQTAPRTAEICRDAYGSVLFIDEAYSLYKGDGNNDPFGLEAIDTLISEMENHRSDMVVIMAGYPSEMETLMRANPGLESRMPYLLDFPNYDRESLVSIFFGFCKGKFAFENGFESAVRAYFAEMPQTLLDSRDFSNARFVRNLFERTWGKASMRTRLCGDSIITLCVEDFRLASSDREFEGMMKRKPKGVGFTG